MSALADQYFRRQSAGMRRAAAKRLPPLEDGRRDPDRHSPEVGHTPATYGLSDQERAAYARALLDQGWLPWEIQARLARPRT